MNLSKYDEFDLDLQNIKIKNGEVTINSWPSDIYDTQPNCNSDPRTIRTCGCGGGGGNTHQGGCDMIHGIQDTF